MCFRTRRGALLWLLYSAALLVAGLIVWRWTSTEGAGSSVATKIVLQSPGLETRQRLFDRLAANCTTRTSIDRHGVLFALSLLPVNYATPRRTVAPRVLLLGLNCHQLAEECVGADYDVFRQFLQTDEVYVFDTRHSAAQCHVVGSNTTTVSASNNVDAVKETFTLQPSPPPSAKHCTGPRTPSGVAKCVQDSFGGGRFDVIIDTSRSPNTVALAMLYGLFLGPDEVLASGGVYIVDHVQSSYWRAYGGGPQARGQGTTTVARFMEDLATLIAVGDRWFDGADAREMPSSVLRALLPMAEVVSAVQCGSGVCAVRKR